MSVKEHQLFNELFSNVNVWALPQLEEDVKRESSQILLKPDSGHKLSPKQQYEYNSYYWCKTLVDVFNRLESIRTMTGRSLYKKKNEEKSVLLQEWIVYNYEHYTLVYQSILDLALLLTNEVFVLGNPYKKCFYSTICDNTRINGTDVHHILEKLSKTTSKHREGKNLLLHRGERIKLPLEPRTLDTIDVTNMAIKLGIEVGDMRELVTEFLAIHSRTELLTMMQKECSEIESQVEELFGKLLPYYRGMRSFYP